MLVAVGIETIGGYVYDVETGLYYLRSRYYEPETGEFINADILIGGNLYCYCYNNPVVKRDENGYVSSSAVESFKEGHYYRVKLSEPVIVRDIDGKRVKRFEKGTEVVVKYVKINEERVFSTYYGTFLDENGKPCDPVEHYLSTNPNYYDNIEELCYDEDYAYYYGDKLYYEGCSSDGFTQHIMILQWSLGMTGDEIDGKYGKNTADAVEAFQRKENKDDEFMLVDRITGNYTKWRLHHSIDDNIW